MTKYYSTTKPKYPVFICHFVLAFRYLYRK